MKMKTVIEPFRIKSVEPIRITDVRERMELLEAAYYNPFMLRADDVTIDLLSDSGTGAMSAAQWGALIGGDESHAGSRSLHELKGAVRDIFTLEEVIPSLDIRVLERLLFSFMCKPGQVIPNNTHYDTTRANLESLGVRALDLPSRSDEETDSLFNGNMDVAALQSFLEKERERVPFVMMTVTNRKAGGQPVSLDNIQQVKETIEPYGIPLLIDATGFAENGMFIKLREKGQQGYTALEITSKFFSYADGILFSAKKGGLSNIGGFLALRDADLARRLMNPLMLTEGFDIKGGISGRDLAAMALGLYESLEEDYLRYRLRTIEYITEKLSAAGIPVIEPPGGHSLFIDARSLLPHLPPERYPAQSLACALYIFAGIRVMEFGSLTFGRHGDSGQFTPASHEWIRLTLPRRVYTQSHFDYVIEAFEMIRDVAQYLPGLKITHFYPYCRHATAQFHTDHLFPVNDPDQEEYEPEARASLCGC